MIKFSETHTTTQKQRGNAALNTAHLEGMYVQELHEWQAAAPGHAAVRSLSDRLRGEGRRASMVPRQGGVGAGQWVRPSVRSAWRGVVGAAAGTGHSRQAAAPAALPAK
eukprot:scaffold16752_cov140-Isochrysis_galbana.AAC.1